MRHSVSLSPQPSSRQATLRCSTTMPSKSTSGPTPKKHTFLPFKDKLELITNCEAGMAHSAVAAEMGVPRSTVPTIWKNRDKYRQAAASASSTTSLVLRGSRDSRLDMMEDKGHVDQVDRGQDTTQDTNQHGARAGACLVTVGGLAGHNIHHQKCTVQQLNVFNKQN
ncbi:uncharacterized protein LOC143020965 [Oratosquilla oratoria]|uniref:uncharacterized protein LOC143020965 n=1 Tax=Oratosquilla oratoria TaxID=337810 RepID=UPI003F76116F